MVWFSMTKVYFNVAPTNFRNPKNRWCIRKQRQVQKCKTNTFSGFGKCIFNFNCLEERTSEREQKIRRPKVLAVQQHPASVCVCAQQMRIPRNIFTFIIQSVNAAVAAAQQQILKRLDMPALRHTQTRTNTLAQSLTTHKNHLNGFIFNLKN